MIKQKEKTNIVLTCFLFLMAIIFIFGPLYITVITAFKTPEEMTNVLALPKSLNFDNFIAAWNYTSYPKRFLNTMFITSINLILTVITNSMVAYAIIRCKEKSKVFNFMYYYFISAMFIPFNVIMLPLVKQATLFNLDNIVGITFLYTIFGLPLNTFLYGGFVKSIPIELEEAAIIDGATPFKTFYKLIFPLMKPMSATVAIFSVMWTWNDFLMPLVLLTDEKFQTLQLAQYIFQGKFSVQYNLAFASYLLVLVPVLVVYVFCQKWIISGAISGALKS